MGRGPCRESVWLQGGQAWRLDNERPMFRRAFELQAVTLTVPRHAVPYLFGSLWRCMREGRDCQGVEDST